MGISLPYRSNPTITQSDLGLESLQSFSARDTGILLIGRNRYLGMNPAFAESVGKLLPRKGTLPLSAALPESGQIYFTVACLDKAYFGVL